MKDATVTTIKLQSREYTHPTWAQYLGLAKPFQGHDGILRGAENVTEVGTEPEALEAFE